MAENDNPVIAKALTRIEDLAAELQRLQAFVNQADTLEGRQPRFDATGPMAGLSGAGAAGSKAASKKWTPGTFFGKPLAGAVRTILLARQEAAGEPSPASVDEIHEGLTQGSFGFDTNGTENQKNSIRISLGKNSVAFVRLPGTDLFGLVEWYGTRARKSVRKANNDEKDIDDATADNVASTSDTEVNPEE